MQTVEQRCDVVVSTGLEDESSCCIHDCLEMILLEWLDTGQCSIFARTNAALRDWKRHANSECYVTASDYQSNVRQFMRLGNASESRQMPKSRTTVDGVSCSLNTWYAEAGSWVCRRAGRYAAWNWGSRLLTIWYFSASRSSSLEIMERFEIGLNDRISVASIPSFC